MVLDLRSILAVGILIFFVTGVALFLIARGQKKHSYLRVISIGFISEVIGIALLALRDIIPDFFSIILANLFLAIWANLIWLGARSLRDKSWPIYTSVLIITLYTAAMAYFNFIDNNTAARVFLYSFTLGLFLALAIPELLKVRKETIVQKISNGHEYSYTIAMLAAYILVLIARIIMCRLIPVETSFFNLQSIQQLPIILMIAINSAIAFCFLWIWQRKLEHGLEQEREIAIKANDAKSEFISMVSHDIRTPLNAVLGSLQLLEENKSDQDNKKLIDTAKSAGDILLSLVNHVLDIEKIESRKIELFETIFSIAELVRNLESLFTTLAHDKGITFSTEIDPKTADFIQADFEKLNHALTNVIGNAIKFTEKGSVLLKVSSRVGSDNKLLVFQIIDTGSGIKEQDKQKIFNKFQKSSETSHLTDGFGLGLSITKSLVAAMKGKIHVSNSIEGGTLFEIEIPFKSHQETQADIPAEALPMIRGLNILVAEDNEANSFIIKGLLEHFGHRITLVSDGSQAALTVKKNIFDLVLMDINMPVCSGQEALARIRADKPQIADIPILALTAETSTKKLQDALNTGFNGYLCKPLKKADLSIAIEQVYQSAQRAPINTELLVEHLNNLGKERFQQGLKLVFSDIKAKLSAIKAAIDSQDFQSIKNSAHQIKGTAWNWGLVDCARKAGSLELSTDDKIITSIDHFNEKLCQSVKFAYLEATKYEAERLHKSKTL